MSVLHGIDAVHWLGDHEKYVSEQSLAQRMSLIGITELRKYADVHHSLSDDNQVFIPSAYDGAKLRFTLGRLGGRPTISGCRIVILSPDLPLKINLGADNANIFVGKLLYGSVMVNMWRESTVVIGCGTAILGPRIITAKSKVFIARDCMISDEVLFQSSDQHGIVDAVEKLIANGSIKTTLVERHVWVGRRATIMGNVTIGSGSVVATGAVVTKNVPGMVICGGNPARVLRQNMTWSRDPDHIDAETALFLEENRESIA